MAEETKNEVPQKTRRTFVRTAAQVAVTAPAVAVLLSAATTPAAAARLYDPKNRNSLNGDDFVTSTDDSLDDANIRPGDNAVL